MSTFGKIQAGERFTYNGSRYTKLDETTGVSIRDNVEKIHFFTGNEPIEVDN